MRYVIVLVLIAIVFNSSAVELSKNDSLKKYTFYIQFSLQSVLSYENNIEYRKPIFGYIGGGISRNFNSGALENTDAINIGLNYHSEKLNLYFDNGKYGNQYYQITSSHISIPLSINMNIGRNQRDYFFLHMGNVVDFIWNVKYEIYKFKQVDNTFSLYKDYLEIGFGANLTVSKVAMKLFLNFCSLPIYQREIIGRDIKFSQIAFGFVVAQASRRRV